MSKSNSKSVRYHFTAPASDVQIAEWAEKQHSFSTSLRIVIKDFIARHGMTDASCMAMSLDNSDMNTVHHETQNTAEKQVAVSEAVKAEVSEPVKAKEQTATAEEAKTKEPAANNEQGITKTASAMLDELMM